MFTEHDLRELVDFSAASPVLSVYLDTDPSKGNADGYRLRLRNLLKLVNLPQDVAAVENYFSHKYDWTGRGVAVFSCAAQGFFRAFPLALPVRDWVHIGDRPSVRLLAGLSDSYGSYGVVLIDKQGARLFHFHLGELHEQEGTIGKTIKHIKHGSASTLTGRRAGMAGRTSSVDEIVERNMKDAADFAVRFFEENHIRRILIGGTDENVSMFRSLLPKAWQSLVEGSFAMPMTASHNEVHEKAMQIGREAELRHEKETVEQLITQASKAQYAVVGLEETLQAVNSGRVQILMVMDGFRKSAHLCKSCGYLTTKPSDCLLYTSPSPRDS